MIFYIILLILPVGILTMDLHEAVKKNLVLEVQILANSTTVTTKDNDGAIPLHHVRSKQVAEILLECGADVNTTDLYGNTALHYLACCYDTEKHHAIVLLLDRQAAINFTNYKGYTPLSCINWPAQPTALVELLLDHGATITRECNQKAGDVDHAVEYNCDEIVKLFIQKRGAHRAWLNTNSQILLYCKDQDRSKIVKLFDQADLLP